jgi:hypothetical protein
MSQAPSLGELDKKIQRLLLLCVLVVSDMNRAEFKSTNETSGSQSCMKSSLIDFQICMLSAALSEHIVRSKLQSARVLNLVEKRAASDDKFLP